MRWVRAGELAALEFPPADAELIEMLSRTWSAGLRCATNGSATTVCVGAVDRRHGSPARRNRGARRPSAIGRCSAGDNAVLVTWPISRSPLGRRRLASGVDIAVDAEPDELPRHAAVAAVQHADDHFLADVAALGEADRARLDAGLERNRLFVHVAMEQRHAGFDRAASRRSSRRARRRRPRCSAALQRARTRSLDEDIEAGLAGVGDPRDDRRLPAERRRATLPCSGSVAQRALRARRAPLDQRRAGVRPDDRDLRERVGDVAELHVLGEMN